MSMLMSKHRVFTHQVLHHAVRWVSRQVGLPSRRAESLTIEVRYCRNHLGAGRWSGRYRHSTKTVVVAMPLGPIVWPQSLAHNQLEREDAREAVDEIELFVWVLSHELAHADAAFRARGIDEARLMNSEPRIRLISWMVLVEFRRRRERLLESWGLVEPAPVSASGGE